jgi:integrase
MGYVYRPKLKGSGSRGREEGTGCQDARHGREDECPACGARFGKVWWAKYYANGVPVRESTRTKKESEARRFLKTREGRTASGEPIHPRIDRIQYEEVADDLRTFYTTSGGRDVKECEFLFSHLAGFFRTKRIAGIGPTDITRHVAKRREEGAANASINRELSLLSRMLRLAYENGKLLRMPIIRRLKEAEPRAGFFERNQFVAVKQHLPPDLQVAISIEYVYGWRCQSEVLTLQKSQVDMNACTIRLEPGTTKNEDGRLVYLTPELWQLLQMQLERVRILESDLGRSVPHLFPHLRGRFKGKPIRDFRRTWKTACLNAMLDGLEGEERDRRRADLLANPKGLLRMLRHDFRRTAVRNMVNRGVPERVAMKITGHKTRSVFDRYHIVTPADLQEAARKLTGTFSGTVPKKNQGVLSQPPDFVVELRGFEPLTS